MFHVKQRRFAILLGFCLLVGLGVACLANVNPRGWAAPVRLGDVTLLSTRDGRLDAIDSQGRHLWRFPDFWEIDDNSADDLDGIYGQPLSASYDGVDVVFIGDYNGFVYAFRPDDFEAGISINPPSAAFFELGEAIVGGMALDQAADVLYVTAGSRLFALTASDLVNRIDRPAAAVTGFESENPGVLFETGDEIWGEPVLADGKVLISSIDGNLYAIDPNTGAEIWRFESGQSLVSTPVVAGDMVLVAGFGAKLFAIDLGNGSERWAFEVGNWIWARPVVDGDIAYVGDFDSVVHAIDLNSGTETWSQALNRDPLRASPVLSRGTLIVSSDGGWLIGIDVASRSVAWQRQLGTKLNADLAAIEGEVFIAPQGCVTPEGTSEKIYYTKVDPRNGDLSFTSDVC